MGATDSGPVSGSTRAQSAGHYEDRDRDLITTSTWPTGKPLGIDVSLVHAVPLHSAESRDTRGRSWTASVDECLAKRDTEKMTKYKYLCD